MKLTALFVAQRGRAFLGALSVKEGRNYQFDFLRPTHSLFGYFNRLVDQYSKVLSPPAEQVARCRAQAADGARWPMLADARTHAKWEQHKRERAKEREDEREAERSTCPPARTVPRAPLTARRRGVHGDRLARLRGRADDRVHAGGLAGRAAGADEPAAGREHDARAEAHGRDDPRHDGRGRRGAARAPGHRGRGGGGCHSGRRGRGDGRRRRRGPRGGRVARGRARARAPGQRRQRRLGRHEDPHGLRAEA
jgi:hypothetical protein